MQAVQTLVLALLRCKHGLLKIFSQSGGVFCSQLRQIFTCVVEHLVQLWILSFGGKNGARQQALQRFAVLLPGQAVTLAFT